MLKEDAPILSQLSLSLKETMEKIEKAYQDKNAEEFNKLRKFFLQIQNKIEDILE